MDGKSINYIEALNYSLKKILVHVEGNFFNRNEKSGAIGNPFIGYLAFKHVKFMEHSLDIYENYKSCLESLTVFSQPVLSLHYKFLFYRHLIEVGLLAMQTEHHRRRTVSFKGRPLVRPML
jgi:hypothetical protein